MKISPSLRCMFGIITLFLTLAYSAEGEVHIRYLHLIEGSKLLLILRPVQLLPTSTRSGSNYYSSPLMKQHLQLLPTRRKKVSSHSARHPESLTPMPHGTTSFDWYRVRGHDRVAEGLDPSTNQGRGMPSLTSLGLGICVGPGVGHPDDTRSRTPQAPRP